MPARTEIDAGSANTLFHVAIWAPVPLPHWHSSVMVYASLARHAASACGAVFTKQPFPYSLFVRLRSHLTNDRF
eukprot:scaffold132853_cov31-Tisochrysis_lutea.AAC.2